MARERLDKLLVDRGLAASRERARALIMSGVVLVGGQPETKPGTLLQPDSDISLREQDHPYVSRGALKLVKGLDTFGIDPSRRVVLRPGSPSDGVGAGDSGMTCLDIGASTGGFTDVLLKRGAKRVYAIDVGYGQLAWSLRQDPRVVVIERTNVRNMDLSLVPEPCDLAVIDVSFISLTLVLPRVVELLRPPPGKPIIALVKPQFEVGRDQVGKGGVVRDEAVRRSAVDKVRAWAAAWRPTASEASTIDAGGRALPRGSDVGSGAVSGLVALEDVESPITGPAGNVEYLLLLRTT